MPDVTPEDVERIVRRDFTAEQYSAVTALLDEYKEGHSGSARVQLAALKLADGSVQKVSVNLESAKRDYRDVLVSAEYPNYYKANATSRTTSAKERQRLIDADWRQDNGWLRR